MDQSIYVEDVIDTSAELFSTHVVPKFIRRDNGPGFVAKSLHNWLERIGVGTLYEEPGNSRENDYAESFHSRVRDEFLASEVYENLSAARWIASVPEQASATPQPAPALQNPMQVAQSDLDYCWHRNLWQVTGTLQGSLGPCLTRLFTAIDEHDRTNVGVFPVIHVSCLL